MRFIPRWITRWPCAAGVAAARPNRERIGTPAQLAAATPGRGPAAITRYGKTATVTFHERRCLWPGVFRCRPVRVIVVACLRIRPALVTTECGHPGGSGSSPATPARWAIEVAFCDAKNHTGAGEARNRLPPGQ